MTSFRIDYPTDRLLRLFDDLEVDIIGGKQGEYIVVYDTEKFAGELSGMGFTVTMLVPNAPLPEEFTDYFEMKTILSELQADYPEIMKVDSLGSSVNGLGIWGVKISDNVDEQEDEPKFLVVASYHGDEVLNVEVAMSQIAWLVESYNSNPDAKDYVDSYELWFIPMFNPDGRMSNPPQRRNMNNVDLNRNHDFGFTPGGIGGHGTAPFSEPETQALKKLVDKVPFTGSITYHSFGDLVLHPWLFQFNLPTPDEDFYSNLGNRMADIMFYEYSHPFRYTVSGGYDDYMYAEFGTMTFTMETGKSKIPSDPLNAIPLVQQQNLTSFVMFLNRMKGPGITGLVTDSLSGKPVRARIAIEGKENEILMKHRRAEPQFGRYTRLLEPGDYNIAFSAMGYMTKEYSVTFQAGETLQVLDVSLQPTGFPVVIQTAVLDGVSGIGTGNGNRLVNRGESVERSLTLRNIGGLILDDIYVLLSTTDENITIKTDSVAFGPFEPDETVTSEQNVKYTVSSGIAPGHIIEINASLYEENEFLSETALWDTVQGFFDNVEYDDDIGWTHNYIPGTLNNNDDWERGLPFGGTFDPPWAHSGKFVWGNDLGKPGFNGNYQDFADNFLQIRSLNFTGWDTVYLQFFRWLTKDKSDAAYISVNGETIWESPENEPHFDKAWTLQTLDISGIAASKKDVNIRFGLVTDESGVAGGWTLDDILVHDQPLLTENDPLLLPLTQPDRFVLSQNYPNPFNFNTNILFDLFEGGTVSLIIYNILGQKIRTLAEREYPAGSFGVSWNGLDDFGISVSTGVYFYKLEVPGFSSIRKMVYIK
ncbi:carboxypeptidase regulatory-like domain-containing protein [candidate division KSB1 bacterium]|nr:carboxypeptidase regulatory-like domain-containing protein [candidate division KSB1 bacterium]